LPEIVADAGLTVNPDKPAEISEAIAQILSDDKLRARLIAAGYRSAQFFSWDKAAREYLTLFQELYENKIS